MYLHINSGCICTNTLSVHNQIVYINCVQQQFSKILPCPNVEPDLWSGSALLPNLGPNLGPVLKSSGSNFGSEPNCGIPTSRERAAASFRYFGTPTHHTIKNLMKLGSQRTQHYHWLHLIPRLRNFDMNKRKRPILRLYKSGTDQVSIQDRNHQ